MNIKHNVIDRLLCGDTLVVKEVDLSAELKFELINAFSPPEGAISIGCISLTDAIRECKRAVLMQYSGKLEAAKSLFRNLLIHRERCFYQVEVSDQESAYSIMQTAKAIDSAVTGGETSIIIAINPQIGNGNTAVHLLGL